MKHRSEPELAMMVKWGSIALLMLIGIIKAAIDGGSDGIGFIFFAVLIIVFWRTE